MQEARTCSSCHFLSTSEALSYMSMSGIWVRTLPGPMHLGLRTDPLCPMFCAKLKEPCSFTKVPDGPYPNILRVQKKEPRYTFHYSQKSWQMNPLQVPQQGPYRDRGLFTRHFAYLSKPHLLGSPAKEPFPSSPSWNPSQRDASPLDPTFIHQLKSLVCEAPPPLTPHTRIPSDGKGTPWREMPIYRDFLSKSSRVHSEGTPPEAPSMELL